MNFDFMPSVIKSALKNLDLDNLYEIRLRVDFPIKINYAGKITYLSSRGPSIILSQGIICTKNYIDEIIKNTTEYSLYAFNDKIKQGFLPTNDGLRIGIAGECVFDNDKIVTIKNITSLNIRIPHNIHGSSNILLPKIINNKSIYNSLIISPPICGKTTILKDLAVKLNSILNLPILIIDERGEFSSIKGENIDSIKYSDKLFAFNYAIRSMSPSIIITDELSSEKDWLCAYCAVNSGVKIIASCHADGINQVKNKKFFNHEIFERYFCLENKGKFGVLEHTYDNHYIEL